MCTTCYDIRNLCILLIRIIYGYGIIPEINSKMLH